MKNGESQTLSYGSNTALGLQRLSEVARLPTPLSTPSPVDTTVPASRGASPSAVPPSQDQVPLVIAIAVLEGYIHRKRGNG